MNCTGYTDLNNRLNNLESKVRAMKSAKMRVKYSKELTIFGRV